MKLLTFTTALVFLIVCLFIFNGIQLTTSPFKNGNAAQLAIIDELPAADVVKIKINHANISSRVKVGLFGNSRSVQVSSQDIGLENGGFFNFAVPGTSFRQSTIYLEQLSKMGKTPEIALVSFDNFELQYFPSPPHPSAPLRWVYVWKDVFFGVMNAPVADTLKILKRAAIIEWDSLTRLFNYELMMRRLKYASSEHIPAISGTRFLPDGSRLQEEKPSKVIIDANSFADAKPNILLDFMARDMARLSKLDARVIIYESPIHPELAIKLNQQPGVYAAKTRIRFLKACKDYNIECYSAPVLEDGSDLWVDKSHAPGSVLGAYLAQILKHEPAK